MSKRKKSAPVKFANVKENWSWTAEKDSETVDNVETEADLDDERPAKILKRQFPIPIFKFCPKDEKYLLKSFVLGSTNNVIPENWKKCTIICAEHLLKLNFDNDDNVIINLSCSYDTVFLKELFSVKLFKFDFLFNLESREVHISLYLHEPQITKFTARTGKIIQKVMAEFFNINMSDVYENLNMKTHENMDDLYKEVKNHRESKITNSENINLQHPSLLPTLRPYQHDAVKWMIQREQNTNKESLHLLYMAVTLCSGIDIYYNKYTGYIDTCKPEVKYIDTGGILADEMGLGKTVEVLACILNNPRPDVFQNENADQSVDGSVEEEPETSTSNLVETIPKIETQTKYVRPKEKVKKKPITQPQKTTKLYNKSATKRAAQIWYESKLAEMVIFKRKNFRSKEEIQCICGDFVNKDLITCRECSKKQHAKCMAYNRNDNNYLCPQCWINQPLIKSRATLIVSPLAICRQWSVEIQRHIRKNGLKVLEYKGIHKAGMIYPTDLADYDIVITNYSVLQSEIKFTNEEQSSVVSLRYAKRYNIPNTPLVFVDWWRVCLDEAQYVECPAGLVSAMARQLHSHLRWAVTGTPIQRHIDDLYGLVDYLQLGPYDDQHTWNHALYFPYLHGHKQPMIEFLATVMWRSAKVDVLGQINIPEQSIQEHWLEFSAVEKFFYSREHESCAKDFLAKLVKFNSLDVTLKSIDRQTLNNILTPLLSLRQACTHPYAVRGRYLTSRKQVNSMEELLEVLIKKNVNDCEESLRAVIASLNGMAGVLLLQERRLEAVEKYRDAMTYMSKYDNADFMKIDKLQRIHTLYNLNEVLMNKTQPAPPPTLRDDKLKEECDSYQRKYMEKYNTETKTALEELQHATKMVNKHENALEMEEGTWLVEILDWLVDENLETEICRKVESIALDSRNKQKYQNISSSREIMYSVTTWIDKVTKQLKVVRKSLKQFETAFISQEDESYISEEIVEKAMECHLRPAKSKKLKENCMCCVLDSNLKKYECMIFQMNTKLEKNQSNKGSWKPSFEDDVVKTVYNYAKQRGGPSDLLRDGQMHVKLCEARRKEFKALRKLYTYFDAQVSAQDELNICKIRFRLKNPEEPVKVIKKKILENLKYETENKYEFIHVMSEIELDINYNTLHVEKVTNEEKLQKLLGTHSYLETLRKQQYAGQNPDPCPICNVQLQDSWSILQCGHCYCLDCIHQLLEQYRIAANHVQCSVCRKKQLCSDISYIKVNSSENTIDDIEIKGSYSTKIHAVIRCVLKLKQTDPEVKILIFSTWPNVLKAISDAFNTNDVKHEYVMSTNLQDKLQRFKDERLNVTALLLPIRLGANGLNLTEATHVLLVEPLMNPGEELQAIGRVHRIGQTKPTYVHRFLIKNTMEENIHNAISTNAQQWEDNKLTLAELKNLFSETNSACVKETD